MRHSRRNPFNIGDVAGHTEHDDMKGIVVGTPGKWVKLHVIGKDRPGGKPYVVRFTHQKMYMIMTYQQRVQMAQQMYQQQAEAAARNKGIAGAARRVAAWVRRLGQKSSPAPTPQA